MLVLKLCVVLRWGLNAVDVVKRGGVAFMELWWFDAGWLAGWIECGCGCRCPDMLKYISVVFKYF